MQKTEEFCVDESGWIHCPFVMQNADKDTGRHFIEELSNILSQMQTGMFDRCCQHENTIISSARR